MIYVLTEHDLIRTAEPLETVLGDYGVKFMIEEIKWFRIFSIDDMTKELSVLSKWGDITRAPWYKNARIQHRHDDLPTQFSVYMQGYQAVEGWLRTENHLFLYTLAHMEVFPNAKRKYLGYKLVQARAPRGHLRRKSGHQTVLFRVNGMRAFFE